MLGVRFLPYLMGELRSTLVWGYQVHTAPCPPHVVCVNRVSS